jgi:hypothetical protein
MPRVHGRSAPDVNCEVTQRLHVITVRAAELVGELSRSEIESHLGRGFFRHDYESIRLRGYPPLQTGGLSCPWLDEPLFGMPSLPHDAPSAPRSRVFFRPKAWLAAPLGEWLPFHLRQGSTGHAFDGLGRLRVLKELAGLGADLLAGSQACTGSRRITHTLHSLLRGRKRGPLGGSGQRGLSLFRVP